MLPDDNTLAQQINQLNGYSPEEKMQILQAIKSGNEAALQFLIHPQDKPDTLNLVMQADAFGRLADIQKKADLGTVTRQDLQSFAGVMLPFTSPSAVNQAGGLLFDLGANSQLINLLNTAHPGNNGIPGGNGVQIVWVPGLPPGSVVSLGNGAILAGIDCSPGAP